MEKHDRLHRVETRRPWFPKADTRNTRNQTLAVSPSCDYYSYGFGA